MYRHVQEIRTQMVVRFRDRRLWLEVQTQEDVRVQARTGGRDADGCKLVRLRDRRLGLEVQTQKDVRVQARTGGMYADGCEVLR